MTKSTPADHSNPTTPSSPDDKPGSWSRHFNLICAAIENLTRNVLVYLIASVALITGLTLLLATVAVSEGMKTQALRAVRSGADIYCTWDYFGRPGPFPRSEIETLSSIAGVTRTIPRIIGRTQVGEELAIVVGIPLHSLSDEKIQLSGTLPVPNPDRPQVLIGYELARHLNLNVGDRLTLQNVSSIVFQVAGITKTTSSLWSAKAIVCDINEAVILFDEPSHVSDVCLYTLTGAERRTQEIVQRTHDRVKAQTQEQVRNYVTLGMTLREGVFSGLFILALVLAIGSFSVITYHGFAPRRREIALLKAEGWNTTEIIEMIVVENTFVSFLSTALSLILAIIWVRIFRAAMIAPVLIAELPLFPEMDIPAIFTPLCPILATLFSLVVTMSGSIYTTWRTATAPVAAALQ